MSQTKNVFLLIFVSLLFCNQVDAMKRARQQEMQDMVIVGSVVDPVKVADFTEAAFLSKTPKKYWDGQSPYDGSMIIKATTDHQCNHCNLWITDESVAAHAFGKHADIYAVRPQKKIKIQLNESSSDDSSDSSQDKQDDKLRFVTKVLKKGQIVRHVACSEDNCRFSCARFEEMNNHKKLHRVDNCFVCRTCDFRATGSRVFINHTQIHLPKEKRSNAVTCSICKKLLSKESSLKRHMSTQHPETFIDAL